MYPTVVPDIFYREPSLIFPLTKVGVKSRGIIHSFVKEIWIEQINRNGRGVRLDRSWHDEA